MTDLSRDDLSRDGASSSKEGHIWRGVGVSAEAPARRPANGRMPRGRGFPGCGSLRTQEHARTGPRCMSRTEIWSFSCTQVLFIGVSQAHRAVDQRLRTCERRDSALAPLRRITSSCDSSPAPLRQLTSSYDSALAPLRRITSRRDSSPAAAPSQRGGPLVGSGRSATPRSRCGRRSTACGTCPRDQRACTCERRRNRAAPG